MVEEGRGCAYTLAKMTTWQMRRGGHRKGYQVCESGDNGEYKEWVEKKPIGRDNSRADGMWVRSGTRGARIWSERWGRESWVFPTQINLSVFFLHGPITPSLTRLLARSLTKCPDEVPLTREGLRALAAAQQANSPYRARSARGIVWCGTSGASCGRMTGGYPRNETGTPTLPQGNTDGIAAEAGPESQGFSEKLSQAEHI